MSPPDPTSAWPVGSSPAGAIHDIGYRPYTGVRRGRRSITMALYVHSVRTAFGLGRTAGAKVSPLILLILAVVPIIIVVAMTIANEWSELPMQYTEYTMFIQIVIGLFLATTSPQLFARDLRFNTITLYVARPLERVDYVIAKFAALLTALLVLTWLPLIILYAGALLAQLDVGEQTIDLLRGLTGATLLSLLLAGIGGLVASVAVRRGIAVAAIIAILVLSATGVSMVGGAALAADNETVAEFAGLFAPFTLVDGVQVWALGADNVSSVLVPPDTTLMGFGYLFTTVALSAGCFALLVFRYRKVTQK